MSNPEEFNSRRDPMVACDSLICTCTKGAMTCALPTSHHCFVCGTALCEACRFPVYTKTGIVSVCGCGDTLCRFALQVAVELRKAEVA